MRAQSGIDEALRTEGLDRDILEIRKLARGELGGVVAAARDVARLDPGSPSTPYSAPRTESAYSPPTPQDDPNAVRIDREREFPREGADGRSALPDTAIVYDDVFPASTYADDPVYTAGIATPLRDRAPEPEPYVAPEPEPYVAPAPEPYAAPEPQVAREQEEKSGTL